MGTQAAPLIRVSPMKGAAPSHHRRAKKTNEKSQETAPRHPPKIRSGGFQFSLDIEPSVVRISRSNGVTLWGDSSGSWGMPLGPLFTVLSETLAFLIPFVDFQPPGLPIGIP